MDDWTCFPAEIWEYIALCGGLKAWGRMHRVCRWFNELLSLPQCYTRALLHFSQYKETQLTLSVRSRCLYLADGKRHGREVAFTTHKFGKIEPPLPYFEQDWMFGLRHGQRVVYDLRHYNIKEISEWAGGKKHGITLQWSTENVFIRLITYEYGKRHGMEAVLSASEGTPLRISFFTAGKLKGREYNWRKNVEPGFCRYYEHGDEGEWPNGRGICAEPTELLEQVYSFAARDPQSFRRSVQLPDCPRRPTSPSSDIDAGELA